MFKSVVKKRIIEESSPIGLIYDQELARANFSQSGPAISLSSQEASMLHLSMTFAVMFF
jgi:hypothetical protein